MRLEIEDAELDYIYRLLVARPMAEVEPLVIKLRVQITRQQQEATEKAAEAIRTASVQGDLPLP